MIRPPVLPSRSVPARRALPLVAGTLSLALLAGGCDDPSCVFGGDCFGDGSGGTDSPFGGEAARPVDGQWLEDERPAVEEVRPQGPGQHPETPVLVVFSESISPASLQPGDDVFGDDEDGGTGEGDGDGGTGGDDDIFGGGVGGDGSGGGLGSGAVAPIELVRLDPGAPVPEVVATAPLVLGDGRAIVLLPTSPLAAGDYQVRLGTESPLRDLTGQAVVVPSDGVLATFAVPATPPSEPRVVATYPPDGATGESETGQVVVAFDRPMDATTFAGEGWSVTVDGAPPAVDPVPAPVGTGGGGFGGIGGGEVDTRVFVWRSADPVTGTPVPLGLDADVELRLSPASDRLEDENGEELATTAVGFRTAAFGAPAGARLTSLPEDAIGLANLGLDPSVPAGEERELELLVNLHGARGGDEVHVVFVGPNRDGSGRLAATAGSRTLPGTGPVDTTTLGLDELELVQGTEEPVPKFADGVLSVAVRIERNGAPSPVRLLDVDPLAPDLQEVLLDTSPPAIEDLALPGGDTSVFRSDLRDLAVSGFASEDLGAVEVRVPSLDANNGALFPEPPGVTAVERPDGEGGTETAFLFTAAPVPLGVVDGALLPLDFEVRVFDRALNASPAVVSSFVQAGAVGPGAFAPGDTLDVHVFDALDSLAPLEGVRVSVFSDVGDGSSYPFVDDALTDETGHALVSSSPNPGSRPIVVVAALGYDVFTFHGATSARIDVPLRRTGVADAGVSGEVTAASERANTDLLSLDARLGDSRRPDARLLPDMQRTLPWVAVDCTGLPQLGVPTTCEYAAVPIRAGRLGAESFLAGRFDLAASQFNVDQALQAFELLMPLPIAVPGESTETSLVVNQMLVEASDEAGLAPRALDDVLLVGASTAGIDFANLVGDPGFAGGPIVAVEALAPGIAGAIPVGFGNAYAQGDDWNVRSVHAGAAGPEGLLTASGALEADLLLRVEVRDGEGDRAGRRPRVSQLAGGAPAQLVPTDVPALTEPAGGATGGGAFDVVFDDVLPDDTEQAGLYRVVLEDEDGRRWELYTPDRPGQTSERVRVLDGAVAGATLAPGEISCSVSAYAWSSLDPAGFLWSDREREYDRFAEAAPVVLQKP